MHMSKNAKYILQQHFMKIIGQAGASSPSRATSVIFL